MENERREYSRIRIDAVSQFIIAKDDHYEGDFEGIVKDISEGGIDIMVNNEKYFPFIFSISFSYRIAWVILSLLNLLIPLQD